MASTLGTVAAGIAIIIFGYLIGFRKMLFLIIGYSESNFYGNKDKYAKRVGLFVVAFGSLIITMPFSVMVFGDIATEVYKYLVITMVIILVVVSNYWRFRY
ncbi:DUF3784 domain-containing protein [Bacillus sp. CECT 9360]|uniref:DUF3784 domain-containing protein n=1 Tax=Bacillus sp. CECT 9360 TaxID=2845821 RepID=UPI001E35E145|nr:DUF3784 domain-containing protein [Bacillus sp. CECT 9360]CAH0344258.1 hypothetical protein BCI9360_00501 [Bacillus sp. CECT 9360]